MPFEGRQLTFGECLSLASYVGFAPGHGLLRMVAIYHGESGRYCGAYHNNLADDGVTILSVDRGLPMINSVHQDQISVEDMLKPIPAAQYAFHLVHDTEQSWGHWAAYNNRSVWYEQGLYWAKYFYENGTGWRRRIPKVPEMLGEEP